MRTSNSNRANRIVGPLWQVYVSPPARALCAFTLVLSLLTGSPLTAQPVLYVDADASGPTHDGSSWCDAFLHLQDALAAADASGGVITEIRVAKGIYKPDQGFAQSPGDRSATFQLISGISIFGGYAGCGEPDPNERDPNRYETVLSGDLNGDDEEEVGEGTPGVCCYDDGATECDDPTCIVQVCRIMPDCCTYDWTYSCRRIAHTLCCNCQDPLTTHCDNSIHVVTGSGTSAATLIDGFIITGGNADGFVGGFMLGGGMFIFEGSPTVANCVFARNRAGGPESGPGFRCGDGGGGLYTTHGNPRLMNCVFRGNTSRRDGGGMINSFGSVTLLNCIFSGNTAGHDVGALMTRGYNSSARIINCSFTRNSAGWIGGLYAIHNTTITNCILWGNSDPWGTTLTAQIHHDALFGQVNYTCIQGFYDEWHPWYGGVGIIDDDPMFVDADGADDIAGTADDDLRLMPDSPCINRGDPGFSPEPGVTDLGGQPRLQGCRVDMGAYETNVLQLPGDFDSDGNFDLVDFAYLQLCFNAQESNPDWLDACLCGFDFDDTDTIDLVDFAAFEDAVTGPRP